MDTFLLAFLLGLGLFTLKWRQERRRIVLLATHLRPYPIERLMEQITLGYQRALDEDDAERRAQLWSSLEGAEKQLAQQFSRFSADMARLPAQDVRICRWALPGVETWWPQSTFDLRAALDIHARGLQAAVDNADALSPKARAYRLMAEMLLMQHTCHWFCKSKTVASARLLARHRTTYEQVLDAVSEATRSAYGRWVSGQG
ncbi:hypothetical protein [Tepidicella baoligensis]|uniref:hypothetical protein n=1 Tax=Tepidicella baoligensis TaxID=2707016 RepID=UPI0015D9EB62|nr:hypothetical protein [Tepidicella baoligensis]